MDPGMLPSTPRKPGTPRTPVNRRGLAVAAVITVVLAAGVIASATGAKTQATARHAAVASKPSLAAGQSPRPDRSQTRLPTLADGGDGGDGQCAITYRTRGNSAMTWTAIVTVAGRLITHAENRSGNNYRRTAHVTPGSHVFAASVPLSQITDIGGVLYAAGTASGCSVALHPSGRAIRHTPRPRRRTPRPAPVTPPKTTAPPTTAPPATTPPTTAACYPLSDEGHCYQPGEFCRDSDHGVSGVDADGGQIVCEDNDGWRWEPA